MGFMCSSACGILGQVWYFIVLIPDLTLLILTTKYIVF